ncbi:MAG: MazG nucleotide pyrophosphohydrolase domain-containing protein, partial [Thermomicrobiales bacterium]
MSGCIRVIGLGPGDPLLRTVAAQRALDGAARIILRTAIHPGLDDLIGDPRVASCDDLYETLSTFEDVYAAIMRRVIAAADAEDVVYALPGSPNAGERTVRLLAERARADGVPCVVESAVGALDVIASAVGIDLMSDGVQLIDALNLNRAFESAPFDGGLPELSPLRPALITQVHSAAVASDLKLNLARLYPEDHEVTVVRGVSAAHDDRDAIRTSPLHEIDRVGCDHLTSIWVPSLPLLEATRSPGALLRIVAALRRPDGCAWDREQSHESLRFELLEEAYEAAEAIDEGDPEHLAEELGDVLLEVAMHAQIAEEAGDFSIGDVYDGLVRKLIRRHPHVFGDAVAADAADVVNTWNEVKRQERAAGGRAEPSPDSFEWLPKSMPILTRVVRSLATGEHAVTAPPGVASDLGDRLLRLIEEFSDAGADPERELAEAYRR